MEQLPLKLSIPTATKVEVERGLGRCLRCVCQSRRPPRDCRSDAFELEGWDVRGFEGDIPDGAFEAALVWGQAERAAEEAACAGWSEERLPPEVNLALVFDPETQFADRDTALAMLRSIAEKGERNERDGTLAWTVSTIWPTGRRRESWWTS